MVYNKSQPQPETVLESFSDKYMHLNIYNVRKQ